MSVSDSRIGQRRRFALETGGADYTRKRQELISVAASVFRERGYKAATLNEVAERFGTDRASLYYYVADKEELFHEAIKGVLDANLESAKEIVEDAQLSVVDKLEALIHTVLQSYEDNYPSMFVYIQEDMAQISTTESSWATQMMEQTRRMEEIFSGLIEEAIREGAFRDDLPPRLAAYALYGMLNWTHRWYQPGKGLTASEIADAFCSLFNQGMRTRP